jgi:hypothetical protein
MTEAEWLSSEAPSEMLRFLCEQPDIVRRKAGRRKLRLFGCACCRHLWEQMIDPRTRAAVEVAERLADDKASASEVAQALQQAQEARRSMVWYNEEVQKERVGQDHQRAAQAACTVLDHRYGNFAWAGSTWGCGPGDPVGHKAHFQEQRWQAMVLRCLFGNPFHPLAAISASISKWNDRTIPNLAEGIYQESAFDRLPVLADALEEAGCTDAGILSHCRQPGEHVRGCWVVDQLLSR